MPRSHALLGLSVLTLTLSGLLLVGGPEVAAVGGATCHGEPATFVGAPGGELHATDGPDVIVTNGAEDTYAGDGDDLVCVTGGDGTDAVDVLAGDGDDVVDATASGTRVRASLGGGDDTYTGGPRSDWVEASDPFESPRGQGDDVIATHDGDDSVITGGSATTPDHDDVDLGAGDDEAQLDGAVDPLLPIDAGTGTDELVLNRSTLRSALVIDNIVEKASDAGGPAISWHGVERFNLQPWGAWVAPSFVGDDGAEKVWSVIPLTSIDLGGGDDLVNLHVHGRRLLDHAAYAGGAGEDTFILNAGAGDQARRVDLDLVEGQLMFRPEETAVRADIDGFERFRLSARRLDVRGTAATDHVRFSGCRGVVAGGPGDDVLEAISIPDAGCGYAGEDAELVTRGGPGDDTLVGEYMPDILIGGPGDDFAHGHRNTDRCVAETERGCER
ncbi:hypothetical protein [Nocardioides stalactiti]|uniref:hypothetical protein n=1 Tax=Nocardioides stalactiti TaxID=2755356 RepID=UPI0016021D86|nr:hypothetical protein [Nocardioides stalactiti]